MGVALVQLPVPIGGEGRTPTVTSPDEAQRVAIEENFGSVLMYLVGEIKDLKQRVGKPPVIKKEASELSFSDEEDDDSVSTGSTRPGLLIPKDHGR